MKVQIRTIMITMILCFCATVSVSAYNQANGITVAIRPTATSIQTDATYISSVGPGAEPTEYTYSRGGTGPNGFPEYIVNFAVSKYLKSILDDYGYNTFLVREEASELLTINEEMDRIEQGSPDISIIVSCRKRQDLGEKGAMIYYPGPDNAYVGYMSDECYRLANCILSEYLQTGLFDNSGFYASNTTRGINWSKVPTINILLGCISDEGDESVLSNMDNWELMAQGIANGINKYYGISDEVPDLSEIDTADLVLDFIPASEGDDNQTAASFTIYYDGTLFEDAYDAIYTGFPDENNDPDPNSNALYDILYSYYSSQFENDGFPEMLSAGLCSNDKYHVDHFTTDMDRSFELSDIERIITIRGMASGSCLSAVNYRIHCLSCDKDMYGTGYVYMKLIDQNISISDGSDNPEVTYYIDKKTGDGSPFAQQIYKLHLYNLHASR